MSERSCKGIETETSFGGVLLTALLSGVALSLFERWQQNRNEAPDSSWPWWEED